MACPSLLLTTITAIDCCRFGLIFFAMAAHDHLRQRHESFSLEVVVSARLDKAGSVSAVTAPKGSIVAY